MNAHEVIVTIMLNYIMFYLMSYLLRTQGALQAPGSSQPKTAPIKSTAILPNLFGASFPVNLGIVLAVAAALGCWWLLERSTFGFQIRAVGLNQRAAKTAGMSTAKVTIGVMTLAGALVGLAGAYQVLGAVTTGFGSDIDDNVGFDAITVALLGRSRPWGVFWSGLLFGAFKAGGFAMQAANGVSIDIVLVVQSLIVLFIAAPPLIRALFHLPQLGRPARRVRATEVTA